MRVYSFPSEVDNQRCPSCNHRESVLFCLAENEAEAKSAYETEKAYCGVCLCEVMASSGHKVQEPDMELSL